METAATRGKDEACAPLVLLKTNVSAVQAAGAFLPITSLKLTAGCARRKQKALPFSSKELRKGWTSLRMLTDAVGRADEFGLEGRSVASQAGSCRSFGVKSTEVPERWDGQTPWES